MISHSHCSKLLRSGRSQVRQLLSETRKRRPNWLKLRNWRRKIGLSSSKLERRKLREVLREETVMVRRSMEMKSIMIMRGRGMVMSMLKVRMETLMARGRGRMKKRVKSHQMSQSG